MPDCTGGGDYPSRKKSRGKVPYLIVEMTRTPKCIEFMNESCFGFRFIEPSIRGPRPQAANHFFGPNHQLEHHWVTPW